MDYNDGKWHGWNGGECPVHPDTWVEAVWVGDGKSNYFKAYANRVVWENDEDDDDPEAQSVIAFRVVEGKQ